MSASRCRGTYSLPIRRHPVTNAGECLVCGRRFDAGEFYRGAAGYLVPPHPDSRRPPVRP